MPPAQGPDAFPASQRSVSGARNGHVPRCKCLIVRHLGADTVRKLPPALDWWRTRPAAGACRGSRDACTPQSAHPRRGLLRALVSEPRAPKPARRSETPTDDGRWISGSAGSLWPSAVEVSLDHSPLRFADAALGRKSAQKSGNRYPSSHCGPVRLAEPRGFCAGQGNPSPRTANPASVLEFQLAFRVACATRTAGWAWGDNDNEAVKNPASAYGRASSQGRCGGSSSERESVHLERP